MYNLENRPFKPKQLALALNFKNRITNLLSKIIYLLKEEFPPVYFGCNFAFQHISFFRIICKQFNISLLSSFISGFPVNCSTQNLNHSLYHQLILNHAQYDPQSSLHLHHLHVWIDIFLDLNLCHFRKLPHICNTSVPVQRPGSQHSAWASKLKQLRERVWWGPTKLVLKKK